MYANGTFTKSVDLMAFRCRLLSVCFSHKNLQFGQVIVKSSVSEFLDKFARCISYFVIQIQTEGADVTD